MRRSERARWLQARTRNATRHTLLMAGAGSVVLVAALLTFVLVPRQVDRTLAAALKATPEARDTLVLLAARATAERTRDALNAQRARAQATRDSIAALSVALDSAALLSPLADDAGYLELQQQVERAKQAPLVESYRALAETRALRGDRRARATLDSIEVLHREREAWAALGGPDARYAALTEQLTRLGARLVQRAEDAMAVRRPARESGDTTAVGAGVAQPLAEPNADSLLSVAVAASEVVVARADSALVAARVFNADVQRTRDALRARLQIAIPPLAMLLASVVLAVAGGFIAALWREVRRPTVGDAGELETVTRARVMVHRAESARRSRGIGKGAMGAAPRGDGDDAWALLHVLLSQIGDVSRRVQVVADQPALAEVVAFRLASTAARASRATVLVDAVAGGLSMVALAPGRDTTALASSGPAADAAPWHPPRALTLERDLVLDLIRPREPHRRRAPTEAATNARAALAPLLQPYDLAVLVSDAPAAPMLPVDADLVLCAREGVTPLAWLSAAVRAADAEGRPVRAVLLWSGELPLAG